MNSNISTRQTRKNGTFSSNSTPKCAPMSSKCSLAPTQCAVKATLAHSKTRFFITQNPYSPGQSPTAIPQSHASSAAHNPTAFSPYDSPEIIENHNQLTPQDSAWPAYTFPILQPDNATTHRQTYAASVMLFPNPPKAFIHPSKNTYAFKLLS